ncbi:MAG: PAS domain-containing sensor histidine kinase [Chloroflexota bacterium]
MQSEPSKNPQHPDLQPETLARLWQAATRQNTTPDDLLNRLLDTSTMPASAIPPEINLARVLDHVIDGYLVVRKDWRIVHAGGATIDLWGTRNEDIAGKTAPEILPEDREIPFKARWEQAFADQQPVHFTDYHPYLNIWMAFYGVPMGDYIVIGLRDVDETIRREQILLANELRLQTITQNLPVVIYTLDKDGVFTYSAGKGLAALGLEESEAVGQNVFDVFSAFPDTLARLREVLAGEERNDTSEINGTQFSSWEVPLWGKDSTVDGLLGIAIDLTEQLEAEALKAEAKRLEHENQALHRLNNMKSRFMNMVSHEFRTPLTVIQSSTEILERYSERLTPDRRRKHHDNVMRQIEHLKNMLERIERSLDRDANPPEARPAPLHAGPLVNRSVTQFRHSHPNYTYTLVTTGDPRRVPLDVTLVEEALHSLLDNATRYSKPGTTVTVTVSYGKNLQIAVTDEGMGIDRQDLENIFQPFFRSHAAETIAGTGIGLGIVKQTVEAHGGTINVQSTPGAGTTIWLNFPGGTDADEEGAVDDAGGE